LVWLEKGREDGAARGCHALDYRHSRERVRRGFAEQEAGARIFQVTVALQLIMVEGLGAIELHEYAGALAGAANQKKEK
jgi:hypothetical protein